MSARPPNVLLVICDDLAFGDLGCYGNAVVDTPRLDQLAAEGTRLTRYYSGPLCTPARASLLTGRHAYRTRAVDTYLGRSMIDPAERTLAHLLHDAGYATGLLGKWHLGDCHPMRPTDMGFDTALWHTGGGLEQPANLGRASYYSPDLMRDGRRITTRGYCTDLFTDEAVRFIDDHPQAPFFAYVAYNAPHDPLQIGDEWVRPYRERGLDEKLARYYGTVENIDHNVGRLLDALDRNGVADDTIVIFTSDHGPADPVRFNGGLRGMKCSMYEGGLRVPCLVRRPGHMPAGKTCDALAGVIDWVPTLAAACDATLPTDRTIDGIDLQPILTGDATPDPGRTLVFQWHRGDVPEPRRNAAVITNRHKLVFPQRQTPQLFDLIDDEGEQRDLGGLDHDVGRRLAAVYDAWFADVSNERPDNFAPPRIVIGTDAEPETVLTWQDWRLYDPRPDEWWKPEQPGYWLVHVARAGTYRVCVDLPPIDKPTTLHVRCGGAVATIPALPRDTSLALDAFDMPAGDARFEAFLSDGEAPRLGVLRVLVGSDIRSPT